MGSARSAAARPRPPRPLAARCVPPPHVLVPGSGGVGPRAASRCPDVNIPQKGSPERGRGLLPRRDGGAVRRADWLCPQRAAQWGGCGGGRGRGALAVRTFFSGARSPLPFLSTSPSWRPWPMGAGEVGGPSAAVGRRTERLGARPIAARGSPLPAAGRGGISRGTEKRAAFRRGGRAAVTPSAPLAFPAGRARGRAHPEPTAGRERASAGRRRFEVRGSAALGGRGAGRWCGGVGSHPAGRGRTRCRGEP